MPECVCASLRQASRAVTLLYDQALRPAGLTAMQFQILSTIDALGQATIKQLVAIATLDQTTLTRGLALMVRRGWLATVAQKDRRSKAFSLTAKGAKNLGLARPLWAAMQQSAIERLNGPDWQSARAVMDSLIRLANEKPD